jgi:hypothetical protein
MLKPMITAIRPQTLVTSTPAAETLRADWVAEYRSEVPTADRWAKGIAHRAHSLESQERVCRMAEQLANQGVGRQDLFTRLEVADRSVASAADPEAVATAGYWAVAPLVLLAGGPIVIGDSGQPDLRAFGFDPIPFDGHDPAAYAWAMFELTMRARAEGEQWSGLCPCHQHFAPAPIGLARL